MLGASAIGAAPILVRLAEAAEVGPTAAAFWRLALALPLLTLWAAQGHSAGSGQPRPAAAGEPQRSLAFTWRMAVLAGVFFAGDLATWHFGILRTTAANAALLPNLTPVIITVVAWLFLKETIRPTFLAGLAAALAGVVLLSGAGLRVDPDRLVGDALCALTAVWYAAYMLAVKAARTRWTAGQVMLISSAVGAAPLLVLAALLGETFTPVDATGWLWLGLLALAHVAGQGGIAYGLGRLPASLSSLVVLVQPVAGAALGWAIFSERLGLAELAGASLVLAGVLVAQRDRGRLDNTGKGPMSTS